MNHAPGTTIRLRCGMALRKVLSRRVVRPALC
jgi:hypothetical protein